MYEYVGVSNGILSRIKVYNWNACTGVSGKLWKDSCVYIRKVVIV